MTRALAAPGTAPCRDKDISGLVLPAGSAPALLLPEITAGPQRSARLSTAGPARAEPIRLPGASVPLQRGRECRDPQPAAGLLSRGLARSGGRRGRGAGIQPAGPGREPGAERGLLGSSLNSRRRAGGLAGAFLGPSILPQPPELPSSPGLGIPPPPSRRHSKPPWGAPAATRARPGLFRLPLAATFGLFPVTPGA